ncbi:MAG: arsenate reductase (glutaredoxin) [Bacteroidales bacterium]
MKIYHNPRCKKSRAGLEFLKEKGIDPEIVNYIKDGIGEEELKDLLIKLNKEPLEMIRTQEDLYKKQLKGKHFNRDEWIRIMSENPKLIRRPIVVKGYKAVVGDPPENINKLLNA